jgi:hypothetical protein
MIGLIIAIIAIIGGLAVGVFTIYSSIIADKEQKLALIEARNRERLALIDKGMDPSQADKKPYIPASYGALLWGLLLVGVASGAFIGLSIAPNYGGAGGIVIHAMGMFFGGIGLLIYYIIRRRMESKSAR